MREIFRFVEQPRQCSYLPEETASLEVHGVTHMSPAEYADLLSRGYRRFGSQVFRPACESCRKCQSVRVLVQQFTPNAGDAAGVAARQEQQWALPHPGGQFSQAVHSPHPASSIPPSRTGP